MGPPIPSKCHEGGAVGSVKDITVAEVGGMEDTIFVLPLRSISVGAIIANFQ